MNFREVIETLQHNPVLKDGTKSTHIKGLAQVGSNVVAILDNSGLYHTLNIITHEMGIWGLSNISMGIIKVTKGYEKEDVQDFNKSCIFESGKIIKYKMFE